MPKELRTQRLRLLVVAGVLAPVVMAAVGFALAYILRGEIPDLRRWPSGRSLFFGALTAGVSVGLVYVLYKSNKRFERALKESGVKIGEDALRMAGYPIMLVVVSAAGFGEEVLFRAGLQPTIGVIPAALLFGFSHGGWRKEMWAYAAAASISGGLFGYVYQWTGDLWVPVIAHTLHNILATVLLGKSSDEDGPEDVQMGELQNVTVDPGLSEPISNEADCQADGAGDGAAADCTSE